MACFVLALIFSLGLASLPVDAFVDRGNYLTYASSSAEILERGKNEGWIYIFTNEPLWLLVNIALSLVLGDEAVVRVIVFFSSFITAYLALKVDRRFFLILLAFLLLPQVMKNYIVHLRQGLAITVFLIGWFSKNRWVRNSFMLLTPFLHASFFFVLVIYYCSVVLARLKFSSGLRVITFMLVGLCAALVAIWLASSLGARQAEVYGEGSLKISGLGFVYWFVVALLFVFQGRKFLTDNSFQMGMLVFYLAIYFFLPISARIFESAVLLVLISGLRLTSWRLYSYLVLLLFYFMMQWIPRFYQPGFGWGAENFIG
ncbi:hypothetical protein ACJ6X8_11725 [Pseudomonas alvandae]|uniref:hypothetical protein n=1 Tax=Pseudomonas TaxID=286 RepID=UPI00389AE75A